MFFKLTMSRKMTDISKFLRRFFQKATADPTPRSVGRPSQRAKLSVIKSATKGEFAKRSFAKRG